jgi:hypothetical protein
MAIKPILFNAEMVRAILDGRKSCTRRLVKPQPDEKHTYPLGFVIDSTERKNIGLFGFGTSELGGSIQYAKPPYQPGDILYVRETWEHFECHCCEGDEHGNCCKEPQQSVLNKSCGCYMYRATDEISGDARWHPSIHMPKEAARIWLKVTDVRVQRLQDMDKMDAAKEGIDTRLCINLNHALAKFKKLWNSTIKKFDLDRYGWDANPWVWVIEFERCEKPQEV